MCFLILMGLNNSSPTVFLSITILFLCLLMSTVLWKNPVFLSPSLIQFSLDFISQNSSSWSRIVFNSSSKDFSSWCIEWLNGSWHRHLRTPSILLMTLVFFLKRFPNSDLFHLSQSAARVISLSPIPPKEFSQDCWTTVGKLASLTHIGSNLKILGNFWECSLKSTRIGQWLEESLARWITWARGNKLIKSGLATPLSNLS